MLNLDLLKYQLQRLNQEGRSNNMDLKTYCNMYNEFLKMFAHLGAAVKLAFSDVSDKAMTMLKN